MKVLPFARRLTAAQEAEIAALEAALDGDGAGPAAEEWRELRADVRELAEPIDSAFAAELGQRLAAELAGPAERSPRRAAGRARRRLSALPRRGLAVGTAATALIALIVVVVTLPGQPSGSSSGSSASSSSGQALSQAAPSLPSVSGHSERSAHAKAGAAGEAATAGPAQTFSSSSGSSSGSSEAATPSVAPAAEGAAPGAQQGRLQQLQASLGLEAQPADVQSVAGRVARLVQHAGGYVASSQVQRQKGSAGEAVLQLRLPSAHLSATVAALERLAPVRSESQSLQDVTGEYDSASGHLAGARSERAALLKALEGAESASALEAIHARLAQNARQIAADEREKAAVAHRAAEAQVEVTVLGRARAAGHGGGLSVSRGLHDAGRILTGALAVALIVAAVAVPLALLAALLGLGARSWRRGRRERALDADL